MRFVAALLVLALPALADGEPLKAILIAPDRAEAGSDIFLDATQSTGDIQHFIFTVSPEQKGRKQIDTKKEAKDPAKPRMRAIPGVWTVTLMIISTDGDFSTDTRVVTIPGGTPCPSPDPCPQPIPPTPTPVPDPIPPPIPPRPDPTPPPNPSPTPPDPRPPAGEFGVAPKVYDVVLSLPIEPMKRAADARQLADSCDVAAAQIAAGTITNPQDLINGMGVALKALPAWKPAAQKLQAIFKETYAAYKDGRLKIKDGANGISMVDQQGWQTLLKELSVGFRAVK